MYAGIGAQQPVSAGAGAMAGALIPAPVVPSPAPRPPNRKLWRAGAIRAPLTELGSAADRPGLEVGVTSAKASAALSTSTGAGAGHGGSPPLAVVEPVAAAGAAQVGPGCQNLASAMADERAPLFQPRPPPPPALASSRSPTPSSSSTSPPAVLLFSPPQPRRRVRAGGPPPQPPSSATAYPPPPLSAAGSGVGPDSAAPPGFPAPLWAAAAADVVWPEGSAAAAALPIGHGLEVWETSAKAGVAVDAGVASPADCSSREAEPSFADSFGAGTSGAAPAPPASLASATSPVGHVADLPDTSSAPIAVQQPRTVLPVDEVIVEDVSVDEDSDMDANEGACNLGLDAFLVNPSAPTPSQPSALSPQAVPFLPRGRSKRCRWADDEGDVSSEDQPSSYLDAARQPPHAGSVPPRTSSASAPGPGMAAVERREPRRGRRKRGRPRPQLVSGLPVRPVEGYDRARSRLGSRGCASSTGSGGRGRMPVHQRLGSTRRATAPDADGWQRVLPQRPPEPVRVPRQRQHRGVGAGGGAEPRPFPAYADGRCFKCLAAGHRVATCNLPWRCLRCRGLGHLARECRRASHTVNDAGLANDVVHAACVPASPARGGRGRRSRQRRRRRRNGMQGDVRPPAMVWRPRAARPVVGALPAAPSSQTSPSGFAELASPVLAWLDVAWAVILEGPLPQTGTTQTSQGIATSAHASPTPPTTNSASATSSAGLWAAETVRAPDESSGHASMAVVESLSPALPLVVDVGAMAVSVEGSEVIAAPLSEHTPLPSPRVSEVEAGDAEIFRMPVIDVATPAQLSGDTGVEDNSGGPPSFSGRLKRFTQRVFKKVASPLLSPPTIKSSSFKMPLRSRRIAAQPLSRLPVAKRGEYLIMQRMGLLEGRSMEEASHELAGMFGDDQKAGDVQALSELFPDDTRPQRPRGRRGGRA